LTKDQFKELLLSIRDGVYGIVRDELIPAGPPEEGEKVPLVFDHLVVDNLDKWAGRLQSDRHFVDGESIAHAFMVDIAGLMPYQELTVNSMSWRVRVVVDSYIQNFADVGDDNPTTILGGEIAQVAFALRASDFLNVPPVELESGPKQFIDSFTELREFRRPTRMGQALVIQSLGEMFVTLKPITLPRLL
jgi:hypothetical protein